MSLKQKIGFIGAGNMGSAILEGVLQKGVASKDQIYVYDVASDRVQGLVQKFGIHAAKDNAEVLATCEIVLLAIKPQDLEKIAKEVSGKELKLQVLISILAGTPVEKIQRVFSNEVQVVRAMPNLGAKVGEGVTALTSSSSSALKLATQVFSACGKTLELEEGHFDWVTALSGSGPAYFFHLMELMVQKAQEAGMPEAAARLLAVQTGLGAAKLASEVTDTPSELRKKVTSKGGTTEAALKVLEGKGFSAIFLEALEAAHQRGKELSL